MYNIYSQTLSFIRYVIGDNLTEELEGEMSSNDLIVLELDLNEDFFNDRICRISLPIQYTNGRKGFKLNAIVIECDDLNNASSIRTALSVAKQNIKNIIDKIKVEAYSPASDYYVYTQLLDLTNIEFRENFSTKKVVLVIENNYSSYENELDRKFRLYLNDVYFERRYLDSSNVLINIGNSEFSVNPLTGTFIYTKSFNEIINENLNIPLSFMFNSRDIINIDTTLKSYIKNNFEYYTLYGAHNLITENLHDDNVLTFVYPHGIKKYYHLIEYEEELYQKLNIKCNYKCAYNRDDQSYIYYVENNNLPTDSYVLVDRNENKTFFRLQGSADLVITRIEDKYGNNMEFAYNPDVNTNNFITEYAYVTSANDGKVTFEYIDRQNNTLDKGLDKVIFIEDDNISRKINIFYSYYDFDPSEYVEKIVIEYTYENIEKSEFILLDKEEYTFNENGALIKIKKYSDDTLLEIVDINYFQEKVSIVSVYIRDNSNDSLMRVIDYKFNYQKDYTTITDDINNISNTYYFDEYSNVKEIIGSNTSRQSNYYEQGMKTRSYFQPSLLRDNLKNGSFENDLEMWNYSGNIGSIENGLISDKCLKIFAGKELNQSLILEAGERYQINGFVKHVSQETSLNSTLVLNINYNVPEEPSEDITVNPPETIYREVIVSEVVHFDNTKNSWYEITSNEVLIPNDATEISASFHIYAEEEIYLDNLRITYENENNYSLIEELFEATNISDIVSTNDSTKFKVSSLSDVELVEVDTTLDHPSILGRKALKIKGFDYNEGEVKTISKFYFVSGKRNEKYSVGVFLKGKTKERDISKLVVELQHSTRKTVYEFNASPYIGYFQKVFGSFLVEEDFTSLTIKYVYAGHNDIILDGFELYKDTNSINNDFDQNGISMSLSNDVSKILNFFENGKLKKQITNNSFSIFEYNNNNDLIEKRNLFDEHTNYTYSPDRRLIMKMFTNGSENFHESIEYSNNKISKYTDVFNNESLFLYDNRHRLIKTTQTNITKDDSSEENILYNYSENIIYDLKDQTNEIYVNSSLDINLYKNNFEYDQTGNLVKLYSDLNNKTVYDFIYLQNGLLEKIKIDTKEIEYNTYGANGNLVRQIFKYGEYEYEYDWKNRLKRLYLKNKETSEFELILEYTYNKSNNVVKIEDVKKHKKMFYSYDILGRLKTFFDSDFNRTELTYDIYGNISKKKYCYLDYSNEVKYSYPTKEQTKEGYISKLITKYGADILLGENLSNGLLGLTGTVNNISYTYDSTFKMNVANISKKNCTPTYNLLTANSNYKNNQYLGKSYSELYFEELLDNNKNFIIWIKPTSAIYETSIFTLYTKNNIKVADLKIVSGGKVALYVSGNLVCTTSNTVSLNTWNYVSLHMFYNKKGELNQSIICRIKLNNETQVKSTLVDIIKDVTILTIGEYVDVVDDNPSLDVNVDYTLRPMPIKVGLLAVDAYPHTIDTINELYKDSNNYYLNNCNNTYLTTEFSLNNVRYSFKDTFDSLGRKNKKEFSVGNNVKFFNQYQYDKTRLISQTNKNNDYIQYCYDNVGNIISKTFNDITTEYKYDVLNRLKSEIIGNKKTEYTYDENGNIQSKTIYLNDVLTETFTYSYDLTIKDLLVKVTKNQIESIIEYTNTFYPTKINDINCIWAENKLIRAGNNEYEYNSLGLRTRKKTADKEIDYYYDGLLLVREDIETNDSVITLKYIYDPDNMIIGVIEGTNIYYYEKDITGNIIGIIDKYGNYVVKYTYNAWGKLEEKQIIIECNIASHNPFIYKGYYYDVETQLFWVSSRYYSPELCRWISPDSIEYLDPESINGLNLYAYCGNDPVNRFDPSGHAWEWSTFWTGLFMVGTAVSAIALSIATFGAATPLAMTIIAGVTLGAGVLTGINGVATMIEAGTQYNFVRDGVFNGLGWSDSAYDIYAGVTMGIAELGSIILGIYQITPSGKRVMADNEMQRIINNPQRIQRYNTDKFGRLASRSSWDYSPAKNGKGMRAILNDKSIRFNMNGTRFDVAHFYGDPYWVVSSAALGKLKYLYLF